MTDRKQQRCAELRDRLEILDREMHWRGYPQGASTTSWIVPADLMSEWMSVHYELKGLLND